MQIQENLWCDLHHHWYHFYVSIRAMSQIQHFWHSKYRECIHCIATITMLPFDRQNSRFLMGFMYLRVCTSNDPTSSIPFLYSYTVMNSSLHNRKLKLIACSVTTLKWAHKYAEIAYQWHPCTPFIINASVNPTSLRYGPIELVC